MTLILVTLFGINKDIARRERVKQSLRESERKYRRIVDTANEGIWMINKDSRTSFVNKKMAEMLGYEVEEMMGRSVFDFTDEEGRAIAEQNLERRKQGISEQSEQYCLNNPWAKAGRYAQLCITDTGIGMDAATQQRIFEPFFTTKEVGKGTGLGLSVVFGIINQHDGLIHVYSEPGKGTTFRIYLPAHDAVVEESERIESSKLLGGTETILVAEDEESLREMARSVLTGLGYKVLLASYGEEAVEIYRANREEIQLVILDMIMPQASGIESYNRMRESGGDVPVLFITGHSAETISGDLNRIPGAKVIQKPYDIAEFGCKVREALDASCSMRSDRK
ncbi:MAG TPA: response regulator [Blastocatellia bacterium]|nr:response regulator [Blastocatellia bacterium]